MITQLCVFAHDNNDNIVGSEISDPWANLEKSFSLQILIEGPRVRCFQQISTILSLGNSYYNGKSGF